MLVTFLDLPVEIIFLITREQSPGDVISLIRTNRSLSALLPPALIDSVCRVPDSRRAKKALYSAAEHGNRPVIKELLDRGVCGGSEKERCRLLHRAVSMKGEEIGLMLLEYGLNPEMQNEDGWTCLALAAAEGKKKIIRMLLERDDVDVNARTSEGLTPLTAAIRAGKAGVVKMFLTDPRTDVYVRATRSRSPFHLAVENQKETCRPVIEHLLADERLDPNLVDLDRNTALHLSLRVSPHPARRLLLQSSKVNRNIPNVDGDTPFHFAVLSGDRRIVYYMLRYCPRLRVNFGHLWRGTPLHVAASQGYQDIVEALLSRRSVNIDLQDQHGDTPLHLAAGQGHKGIVRLLLERGADFRKKNHDNKSVAMLVETYSHPHIGRIIRRYL